MAKEESVSGGMTEAEAMQRVIDLQARMRAKDRKIEAEAKQRMTDRHLDMTTSSGIKMSDVPEFARKNVIWFDGMDGSAKDALPTEAEVPTPACLKMDGDEWVRFPGWMTGSKAMLDAHGAKARLKGLRPGAWLISDETDRIWAKWPDGSVDQVPKDIELPASLRVSTGDER
jgi:hypothetical protein